MPIFEIKSEEELRKILDETTYPDPEEEVEGVYDVAYNVNGHIIRHFDLKLKESPEDTFIDDIEAFLTYPNGEHTSTTSPILFPLHIGWKLVNNSYTDQDIAEWFASTQVYECPKLRGGTRVDEFRSVLLKIIPIERLDNVLNTQVIETISGVDLYKKYPIGNYTQQGDCLYYDKVNGVKEMTLEEVPTAVVETQNLTSKSTPYDLLPNTLKIRLTSNVFYSLCRGSVKLGGHIQNVTFLRMGNASLYTKSKEEHQEYVGSDVKTVFEAICWRNREALKDKKYLPYDLS